FGPGAHPDHSLIPERDLRNFLSIVTLGYSQLRQAQNWTKIFAFVATDDVNYQFFNGAESDDASAVQPREPYWAFKYLARKAAGATSGISYQAYQYQMGQWY